MHSLKDLRNNLAKYKIKFKDRNLDFNIKEFEKIDKLNRELINKKELLEQEKKSLSKKKETLNFEKSKKITKKIDETLTSLNESQKKIDVDIK
tara:strand:- start:22 stop:300 length:279 start_codon:yes stop_codon:yes gene_type:complete